MLLAQGVQEGEKMVRDGDNEENYGSDGEGGWYAVARDPDALLLRKWGATSALVETPEDAGLDRAVGFPASYGVDMARTLETWQQQMREVSAAFVEAAERGILEWSADQRYEHPAWVTGSDGNLYQTVMSSGGDDPSEDPVGDTEEACWSLFEVVVPESSTSQRGTIETATNAEAQTGTDDERAVPPSRRRWSPA